MSVVVFGWGPFIYYVITFLGFSDLPPHYVIMFLVLKIIKNWHFLTPPSPPTSDYVIYEWSLNNDMIEILSITVFLYLNSCNRNCRNIEPEICNKNETQNFQPIYGFKKSHTQHFGLSLLQITMSRFQQC